MLVVDLEKEAEIAGVRPRNSPRYNDAYQDATDILEPRYLAHVEKMPEPQGKGFSKLTYDEVRSIVLKLLEKNPKVFDPETQEELEVKRYLLQRATNMKNNWTHSFEYDPFSLILNFIQHTTPAEIRKIYKDHEAHYDRI